MGVSLVQGRLDVGGHTLYELLRDPHRFHPVGALQVQAERFHFPVVVGMIRDSFAGIVGLLELFPHGLQAGVPGERPPVQPL